MTVAGIIDAILVGPDAYFSPASTAAQFLVQTPLGVGVGMLAARRYRDGEGDFEDIFIGFKRYWPVVAIGLLMTLGMWVIMMASLIGGGIVVGITYAISPPAAIAVGVVLFLCLMVAMVYLGMRLWFAYLVCVDPRGAHPGPIQSIKLSWYLTSGHVLKLWLTGITMGLIALLCLLLLILPFLFYALPFIGCVTGVLYVMVNPLPLDDADWQSAGPLPEDESMGYEGV